MVSPILRACVCVGCERVCAWVSASHLFDVSSVSDYLEDFYLSDESWCLINNQILSQVDDEDFQLHRRRQTKKTAVGKFVMFVFRHWFYWSDISKQSWNNKSKSSCLLPWLRYSKHPSPTLKICQIQSCGQWLGLVHRPGFNHGDRNHVGIWNHRHGVELGPGF